MTAQHFCVKRERALGFSGIDQPGLGLGDSNRTGHAIGSVLAVAFGDGGFGLVSPDGSRHGGVRYARNMIQHARAGLQLSVRGNVKDIVCGKFYVLGLSIQDASQRNLYLGLLRAALLFAVNISSIETEGVETPAERQ